MALAAGLFDLRDPERTPISFTLGGKIYRGISPSLRSKTVCRRADSCITEYTTYATTPEGLELRLEYKLYRDFPVCEWTFFITNRSDKRSEQISNFKVFDGILPFDTERASLLHGNGDNITEEGYCWQQDELSDTPIVLCPDESIGTSCHGAFPYMRLLSDGFALNLAIGWSGVWDASFTRSGSKTHISIGQHTFDSYLEVGECIRTPSITLMAISGDDESRYRNLWRSFYIAHILPRQDGMPLPSKLCLHTWMIDGKEEFCGTTEENQRLAINTYIEKGARPDIWWIDAGWFPCNNSWGTGTGNFFCNTENYPNGLGRVGDMCHERGIEFLLWFEPERIYRDTWVHKNLPQYLLSARPDDPWFGNNFLLDLSRDEVCDWLIDTIDGCIKEYGVDIYRQDFNFQPSVYWKENEEPQRVGILENKHIQGYYRYWDTLLERNPGLLIDSCASGGRRNDIETMRRSVPLHYTDIGYGKHPIKQNQFRQMHEWIPYFRSHTMAWDTPNGDYGGENRPIDEFSFLTCMTAPAITPMAEFYHGEDIFRIVNKLVPVWRESADIALCSDYYPLTKTRRSDEDWYAAQFDDREHGIGCLHFIRNIACERDLITVYPYVDRENLDRIYVIEDKFTGNIVEMRGSVFASGFTYSAPKRSGTLFVYKVK